MESKSTTNDTQPPATTTAISHRFPRVRRPVDETSNVEKAAQPNATGTKAEGTTYAVDGPKNTVTANANAISDAAATMRIGE